MANVTMAKRNHTETKPLTVPQLRAISALLSTETREAAAREAGVTRQTLFRWLTQPHFIAALKDAEREALSDATRQLAGLSGRAVTAISGVLNDPGASENAKLRAAELIISSVLKLKGSVEFEERITQLEKRADLADEDRQHSGPTHLRAVQ